MIINTLMPIMNSMTKYCFKTEKTGRIYSGSRYFYKLISLALPILAVFLVLSCEEDPTSFGSDILPGSDFVNILSTDTLTVLSYTAFNDSIRTDNPELTFFGQMYDPYFGTSNAEFVTQLRLNPKWDHEAITVDSVQLFLKLMTIRGGEDGINTLSLAETSEMLYTDTAYYSNKPLQFTGFEITGLELPELRSDTINNITIDIPVEFGEHLFRDTSMLFYSNTRDDFRTFFRGLHFKISSTGDPLMASLYLDPPSTSNSEHTIYHNYFAVFGHNENNSKKEYFFILDAINRNAAFSRFIHDYSTAATEKSIEQIINSPDLDTLSYLQCLNGVFTRLSIPGLQDIKEDITFRNIAVNKARLTIPVYFDGDLYNSSTAPFQLLLRYRTEDGSTYYVPDYFVDDSHSFFDGTIDTVANQYVFNLADFVQLYLEDDIGDIEPELEVFQPTTGIENVILRANDSQIPVRFDFIYTRF
jgi:hypothetical protein